MDPESTFEESSPSDWLELANGGGVMFRDARSVPRSQPEDYVRPRCPDQLLATGEDLTSWPALKLAWEERRESGA